MTDDTTVSLSTKAFVKPLLHAAKYPHCSVNGVLLAAEGSVGGELSRSHPIKIIDAIPLFHSSLTLAPMTEIALTQIDVYCKSHGLMICGYYQANENLDNNKPVGVAYRMGDKIKDTCGDACLLMINNHKMLDMTDESYVLYMSVDSKWKKSSRRVEMLEEDTEEVGEALVKSRVYRDLVDFDNYLDDITLDWLNTELDEIISQA